MGALGAPRRRGIPCRTEPKRASVPHGIPVHTMRFVFKLASVSAMSSFSNSSQLTTAHIVPRTLEIWPSGLLRGKFVRVVLDAARDTFKAIELAPCCIAHRVVARVAAKAQSSDRICAATGGGKT